MKTNKDWAYVILQRHAPYRAAYADDLERVRNELDSFEAEVRAKVVEEVEIELLTAYVGEGLHGLIKRIRALNGRR